MIQKKQYLSYFDLGLQNHIEKYFFSCELGHRKPSKEIYSIVVEYSGLDRSQILMIGDSVTSDYQGAKNSGLHSILKDKPLSVITSHL